MKNTDFKVGNYRNMYGVTDKQRRWFASLIFSTEHRTLKYKHAFKTKIKNDARFRITLPFDAN